MSPEWVSDNHCIRMKASPLAPKIRLKVRPGEWEARNNNNNSNSSSSNNSNRAHLPGLLRVATRVLYCTVHLSYSTTTLRCIKPCLPQQQQYQPARKIRDNYHRHHHHPLLLEISRQPRPHHPLINLISRSSSRSSSRLLTFLPI